MNDYIPISSLNDFIFCPYSIYLHNVYMESDEGLYKANPQIKGTIAHEGIEKRTGSTKKTDLMSLSVYSDILGVMGKIDIYKQDKHQLIERKNNLKNIFQGQIYQLWAQYFCLIEMGYIVDSLCFYEISTNKMIEISIPGIEEFNELMQFINDYKCFNPIVDSFTLNINKCSHCIYCNLCDKINIENVYT